MNSTKGLVADPYAMQQAIWEDAEVYRRLEQLRAQGKPAVLYQREIRWGGTTVKSGHYENAEAAELEAMSMALRLGWTPPKRWQFWRWNDTQLDDGLRRALAKLRPAEDRT